MLAQEKMLSHPLHGGGGWGKCGHLRAGMTLGPEDLGSYPLSPTYQLHQAARCLATLVTLSVTRRISQLSCVVVKMKCIHVCRALASGKDPGSFSFLKDFTYLKEKERELVHV